MQYLTYKKADTLNGVGLRNTLWVSRCSHGCKGCFNESSWKGNGTTATPEFIEQLMVDLDKPYIKGLTLTGGDPLHKRNYQEVISLCRRVKKELPEKDIWLYTGYTYYQIQQDILRSPVLTEIAYLVDGRYEKDLPTDKPFRGSSNQVIHKLVDGVSVEQF